MASEHGQPGRMNAVQKQNLHKPGGSGIVSGGGEPDGSTGGTNDSGGDSGGVSDPNGGTNPDPCIGC
jgi:hypothetical protein